MTPSIREQTLDDCEEIALAYQKRMEKLRDEKLADGIRQTADIIQEHINAAEEIADAIAALKRKGERDEKMSDHTELFQELAEICWEGGSLDGGMLQDMLVKHGILVETTVEQPCSEGCSCQHNDAVFPTICCRLASISPTSEEEMSETCKWKVSDPDWGEWKTSCGKEGIVNGTPAENDLAFCCYCGKPLSADKAPWEEKVDLLPVRKK